MKQKRQWKNTRWDGWREREILQKKQGEGGVEVLMGTNYKPCMCLWVCMSDCVSILLLEVPWHALGWPRFQSASGLCWHWGSRLGPLARRLDMPSSRKPVGTVLRADRRPLRSIRFFPVYVLLRPLLFFHSINIIYCTPHKWTHSTAVIVISRLFSLTGETWDGWLLHPSFVLLQDVMCVWK